MNIKEITNQTIYTIDWAKEDRRSVKAYLEGKGDGRVLWWNINKIFHLLLRPRVSLERIMFCFHSRHHAIALLSLKYWTDVQEVTDVIHSKGIVAGICTALSLHNDDTVV